MATDTFPAFGPIIRPGRRSCRQFQLLTVEHFQHLRQIMAPAKDVAGHGNDNPGALFSRKRWTLFDPVDWQFRRAAKDGKHRRVTETVYGVIAPFAGGDEITVNGKDARKFAAGEGDWFRLPFWRGRYMTGSHWVKFRATGPGSQPLFPPKTIRTRNQPGKFILKIALIGPSPRPKPASVSIGRAGGMVGVSGFNHRPQPPGFLAPTVRQLLFPSSPEPRLS